MRLFFFAMATLVLQPAVAQEDSASTSLDEVVITAQRVEQKTAWIPYAVQRISSSYIRERSARTTPEALQGITGVFVQKTNHGGGSAFIRGLTGNQTLIVVDGIRLNNATFRYGPNQYLNTIDPYTIEHLEVVKGTGSVQYGTDALGGVIHVLSKELEFDSGRLWSGRAIAKHMSGNMEKTARGEVGFASKRVVFAGGLTYRSFGDLIGGDSTGKQAPSGYGEWAVNAKIKLLLDERTLLTFSQQNLTQQDVPVYHKVVLENFAVNEFDRQQRQLQYARFEYSGKNNLVSKLQMIVSRQRGNEVRESRKNGSNALRKEQDEINTWGLTADVFSKLRSYWTANTGLEIYNDAVRSSRKEFNIQNGSVKEQRGLYPDGANYGNYSLYALHHFKYRNWVADGGVRLNTFSIRLTDTSLGNVRVRPSALVWNAGFNYAFLDDHHLYLTYSTGYRAPNIDDMGSLGVVDFRYELPTANLKPEGSGNLELGYKIRKHRLTGNVAVYRMRLRNLITRVKQEGKVISGYQVYQKENTEQALIKGGEAEFTWKAAPCIQVAGNISYTHGVNKSKNEPLRRIPPVHGRLLGTFRRGSWFATAEALGAAKQSRLAQGDREDNRIPAGGTPGWTVLNLYAGHETSRYQVNAGLQNILNRDYRMHGSGINGVGRSIWVSGAFHF